MKAMLKMLSNPFEQVFQTVINRFRPRRFKRFLKITCKRQPGGINSFVKNYNHFKVEKSLAKIKVIIF